MFTLVNLFFCHAWLIHVTVEQIQSHVCISPIVYYFFGAEEFPKLFSGLVLASCLASFGTRDLRPMWGPSSHVLTIDWLADADPALEFDALFEEEHNLATEIGVRSIELRCKSESHRFVNNAYMNHALTSCFEH